MDNIQCPRCKLFNTIRLPEDEQFLNNNIYICCYSECWCIFDPTGKYSIKFINAVLQTYDKI